MAKALNVPKVRQVMQLIVVGEGNPDMRQYGRIAPRKKLVVTSLDDAVKRATEYIWENELGCGNWVGEAGLVLRGPTLKTLEPYARISYNGRVWLPNDYTKLHPDYPDRRASELADATRGTAGT